MRRVETMQNLVSLFATIVALTLCVPALAVPQDEVAGSITADLQALADRIRPAVVRIAADGGYGSGFVVEDGTVVVTAWHVVQGAESIWIETHDGTEVAATVLDWDKKAHAATAARQPLHRAPSRRQRLPRPARGPRRLHGSRR
jgi:S1-C subfamily serine protease